MLVEPRVFFLSDQVAKGCFSFSVAFASLAAVFSIQRLLLAKMSVSL